MIKDLVVNLTGASAQEYAADYAVSIAREFGAHADGISFIFDPVIPGSVLGGLPTELIEAQRAENSKIAKAATEHFESACKTAGVTGHTRILDASVAGAADLFGRIARRFDLSVVGQARRDLGASEDLLIEGALFESGRPMVVVPYIQKDGLKLDRMLVCWDGSRPAARAIADAMPFLQRAKAVEVLVVIGERGKGGELQGTNMTRHLARHGINVELKRVPAGDLDVKDAILSYVADSEATLIVMGGYGHSRLREFILGGVTRGILTSMTTPVLMSH